MEVLLKEAVDHLGLRGDVVRVKPGYARNFLFPKDLAAPVTDENRRRLAAEQRAYEARDLARKTAAQEAARRLEHVSINIAVHASEEGALYGSVSERMVADALREQEQIELDHRHIELPSAIKELGQYTATVRLHHEVECPLAFWVVQKKG